MTSPSTTPGEQAMRPPLAEPHAQIATAEVPAVVNRSVAPPSRLIARASAAASVGGFILRLGYFLVAPIVLLAVAEVLPVLGILLNVGLAMAVYFLAHHVRRVPILTKLLGRGLAFEAYYREHPPKPFLYYVFFPLLFPYWLVKPSARRELLAYKGFTGMSLVLLLGVAGARYCLFWRPEIGFPTFAAFAGVAIAIQLFVAMLLLMPLATSVVAYHAAGRRRRLAVLVGALVVSLAATVYMHVKSPPLVHPFETYFRAQLRTKAAGEKARRVLEKAARAAAIDMVDGGVFPDRLRDQWIEGVAADMARAELAALYKSDECNDFRLAIVKQRRGRDALLLFEARSSNSAPKVWIAVDASGRPLPEDAINEKELVNAQLGLRPKPKRPAR